MNWTVVRIALHYSQQQGQQRYFVLSENYWEEIENDDDTSHNLIAFKEKEFLSHRVFNVSEQIARAKKEESCDFNTP